MISLTNAGVEREGRWLARNVTLDLGPGQLTALIGPNGAGKSTTLRMLAGLWKPSEGQASLDGADLASIPRLELAKRLSFVPQGERVEFSFTVRDVVSMGRHPHLGRFGTPTDNDKGAVDRALERADAEHLADRMANELSSGEAQRVLIARALATETEIILLDEPAANLDIDHSLEVMELLRGLADEGKSVVVALHDLNAVSRWADSAALMNRGALEAFGPASEILDPARLERVFGVRVESLPSSNGKPTLTFHRSNPELEPRAGGSGTIC